ncbi:hypothetical protein NGH17_23640, partial [Escherichia coli]|nr:hypothetical protein [Escherichia coli]
SLGPGWKMPADIRLQLRDNTLILSDNGGRSLYFEHLFPGEDGQQAISGGTEPSAFPDTLPGYTEYGRDNGIRLSAVWLTHDPEY